MIVILGVLWWLTGMSGFIYWWTKDHDLDITDAIIGAMVSVVGPLSWPFGWYIHTDPAYRKSCGPVVLIKRRAPKQ